MCLWITWLLQNQRICLNLWWDQKAVGCDNFKLKIHPRTTLPSRSISPSFPGAVVHLEWLKWPFRPGPILWWRPHLLEPHYQAWTSSWADRKSLRIFFLCPSPPSLPVHQQNNTKLHYNRSICTSSSITLNKWTPTLFILSRHSSYFFPFLPSPNYFPGFCIFNKPFRVDVFLIFLNWHL